MQPNQLDLLSWSDGLSLFPWPSDTPLRGWKRRLQFRSWIFQILSQALEVRERDRAIIPYAEKKMSQDPNLKPTRWKAGWQPSWLFYTDHSSKESTSKKIALFPKGPQGVLVRTWSCHLEFSLSTLENHPKLHSIFGKIRRRNSKIFVGVAKSNQVHSGAAWRKLERSQAEISMIRTFGCGRSPKIMTKTHFLKSKGPFQGDPACHSGKELTWFISEKQRRTNYRTKHGD